MRGGVSAVCPRSQAGGLRLLAVFRPLPPGVHEDEGDGGEGGRVHGERPQQRGGEAPREHHVALAPHALPHAVGDAGVAVDSAHAVGLQPRLDHVHGVGGQPGGDARHAAGEQQLGDHEAVVGLEADAARQRVVGQEVDAEGGRLAEQRGDHAAVHAAHALPLVDARQAVQGVLVQLPRGLLLPGALQLHAGLGQLHGAADDALDGAGRGAGEELVGGGVVRQPPHGVALDAEHDGVDEREAHHGGADAFVQAG